MSSRLRARAVRSTPEALIFLESALQDRWRKEYPHRRLTRALRAELLDISEGTVSRLFQNSGVDRPTLIHAFKNVGLDWNERYLLIEEHQEPRPTESIEKTAPIPPMPAPSQKRTILFAGLAALFAVIAFWSYISRPGPGSTAEWINEFNPLLERGTAEYQAGDYDVAERDLRRAVELARREVEASRLSCAQHVLGDLLSARGRLQESLTTLEEACGLRRYFRNDRFLPAIQCSLGETQHRLGKLSESRKSFESALAGFKRFGEPAGVAMAYRGLGTVARKERKFDEAFDHFARALENLNGLKDQAPMVDDIVARRALVYRDLGDFKRARQDILVCLARWRERGHKRWIAETEFQLATIEGLDGNNQVAVKLLTSCNETFREVGDRANEADSAQWLARYRLTSR